MGKETAVAYDQRFDRQAIHKDGGSPFVKRQMETHLGERFNTLLSTFKLDIQDGAIIGQDIKEPFLDTIKRGRDYRRIHGNEIDRRREEAEVLGFEKLQKMFGDPKTEPGMTAISVSPRGEKGSAYVHNFYDIFTLREDETGRFIEGRRYSSALTPVETVKRLNEIFKLDNLPFPNDASLLANPIFVKDITADEIHSALHKKHDYLDPSNFNYLKRAIAPFINTYREALLSGESEFISDAYDALLNEADDIWKELERTKDKEKLVTVLLSRGDPSREYILVKGRMPVRQVMTGCGSSGGAIREVPIFRLADFVTIPMSRGYEFNFPGPCKRCQQNVDCGPCGYCISCDDRLKAEAALSAE